MSIWISPRGYTAFAGKYSSPGLSDQGSDRFVSLAERSSLANRLGADSFISIHINAAENGRERGIETYAHHSASREAWALAWYLQEQLVKELGLKDRGLKAGNFHVIRETRMDSVLLEIGFIVMLQRRPCWPGVVPGKGLPRLSMPESWPIIITGSFPIRHVSVSIFC